MPLDSDSPELRASKAQYVAKVKADMHAAFLARLPDASVAKVMARRGFKSGYDKNMIRAYAQRMTVAANSAASRLQSNVAGEAIKEMTSAVTKSKEGNKDQWAMTSVLREMMRRQEATPDNMISGFTSGLRAVNHNFYLAMNPGYWLTQITQMQTNLWPELVKSGASWKESFSAITSTSGIAMQIVKATLAEAKKRGFLEHGADATLTIEVLDTLTLSPDKAEDDALKEFVMRIYNRAVIDIGSPSREMGRRSEGKSDSKFETTMRWAASGSFYLETLTRLNAGLAARQIGMKQGKNPEQVMAYSVHVVNQAMLNYTESYKARAFGRQGLANEFTPLATAFMSFQFQMIEKYTREFGAAIGATSADPAERKAARRWLGAHFAAMTTLAGSLGLPGVMVIARAVDGLKELFSDSEEPYNSQIAWRNFLADTFGNDVGEVLARGLPRAAGFDISGRIGAAEILPFSRLIADRREWDERLGDMAERTYGSAYAMLGGIAKGGQLIGQGRILDGMREALPAGLRNPVEAIRLSQQGMTDRRGNVLPIDPGPMAVIWQALGLTPAERADYSEANFGQSVRRGVTGREASRIRREAARAVASGDGAALRKALERAREFDSNVSPAFAILPNIASSVASSQRRLQLARALEAPLGVNRRDQRGIEMSRFAN